MRVYHFLSKEHALQAIECQRLKVARIDDLNDPFELLAADLSNSEQRRGFIAWKKNTAKKIGFLCFSKTNRNPLLWSHYADRHRGVALELSVDDNLIVPVRYRRTRMQLDMSDIAKRGGFSLDLAEKLGATKSNHWSYEKEVRVAVQLAECELSQKLYFCKLDETIKITGVVSGPLCDITANDISARLAKGRELMLKYSRMAFRSYEVINNRAKSARTVNGRNA